MNITSSVAHFTSPHKQHRDTVPLQPVQSPSRTTSTHQSIPSTQHITECLQKQRRSPPPPERRLLARRPQRRRRPERRLLLPPETRRNEPRPERRHILLTSTKVLSCCCVDACCVGCVFFVSRRPSLPLSEVTCFPRDGWIWDCLPHVICLSSLVQLKLMHPSRILLAFAALSLFLHVFATWDVTKRLQAKFVYLSLP